MVRSPIKSVAINIAKFDFWKSEKFDQLKLRAAYGESGNFPNFGSKFTTLVPANTGGSAGILINLQRGNDQVKQERQKEFEAGFDIGTSNGNLSLEATYYRKEGTELIFAQNVPLSSGFTTRIINGGTLTNQGVELALNASPVNKTNFKWNSRTSFWKNTSKVRKLAVPTFDLGGFGTTLGTFRIEEGKSATQIVGIDNGGVAVLGNAEPDFQMNFLNDLTIYKNLTFSFLLHWKKGGDNINLTELLTDLGGTSPDYDGDDNGNGIGNAKERTDALGVTARPFIQDAGYLRIREVGLFYAFSPEKMKNWFNNKVSGIKMGVSASNLFTFTKYKSYDPEVSNFGSGGFSSGVEITPFPSSKRLFFHLSVNL